MFTSNQLRLAKQLKQAGLPWEPRIGQYAWDPQRTIRPKSPFQDRVYFFLNFPCFVEYFGSLETLKSAMIWLPTMEQATEIANHKISSHKISSHGISSHGISSHGISSYGISSYRIARQKIGQAISAGIGDGQELDCMYELLITEFSLSK